MARAAYSISPDDYEFSHSFEIINSEISYKKAAICDFITDGDQLVGYSGDIAPPIPVMLTPLGGFDLKNVND